jgi:hypothetical protein
MPNSALAFSQKYTYHEIHENKYITKKKASLEILRKLTLREHTDPARVQTLSCGSHT